MVVTYGIASRPARAANLREAVRAYAVRSPTLEVARLGGGYGRIHGKPDSGPLRGASRAGRQGIWGRAGAERRLAMRRGEVRGRTSEFVASHLLRT